MSFFGGFLWFLTWPLLIAVSLYSAQWFVTKYGELLEEEDEEV